VLIGGPDLASDHRGATRHDIADPRFATRVSATYPDRHWLVLADVGGPAGFHVGDEAMLEANLAVLAEALPRARITVVSNDPAHTAIRYSVDAVASRGVAGPGPGLDALQTVDGLLISGGGNMNATWGDLLHERLDLIEGAHARGLPVVVTGQTIGPDLTATDEHRISELLPACSFVGVRDVPSWWRLRALGVPACRLRYQADDALGILPPPGDDPPPVARYIAVTLSDTMAVGGRAERLADELARLSRWTGLPLRLVPHLAAGARSGAASDRAHGHRLAHAIAGRAAVDNVWCGGPRRVAAVTAAAACVISTRYHPLVFAAGARVPAIGLASDEYTRVRMVGALTHVGRADDVMAVDDALDGFLASRARSLIGEPSRNEPAPWNEMWRTWRAGRSLLVDVLRGARPEVGAPPPPDHVSATLRVPGVPAASGTAPRRPREAPAVVSIRLVEHRVERRGDTVVAAMRIVDPWGQVPGMIIELRHHGGAIDAVAPDATPFIPIAAMIGVLSGRPAHIDAAVDGHALACARAVARIAAGWTAADDHPMTATSELPPSERRGDGVGLFFSRGLDSYATLERYRDRVTHLIGIHWLDSVPAAPAENAVWDGTIRAAAAEGLPLIEVSTNARAALDPLGPWINSATAVLGAFAMLLAPLTGVVLAGSTFSRRFATTDLVNHPDLDALWSSSSTAFHVATEIGERSDKAALLVASGRSLEHLKVCWERHGDGNCGRCAKCLVTLTNFHIAGGLDAAAPYFDAALDPAAVDALGPVIATAPPNIRELVERLDPADPLRAAWRRALVNAEARGPGL
jgi:polysaccharide pyruvyl transferase WcaK-like protein